MSAEENKELVHRFVEEFWNRGKTTAADELMAPDAEIHMPTGEVLDPDELKTFVGTWRESFPDWHSTFEDLVAEGDRVAERWTGRGTHLGELQGIPPTGKRVEAPGSVFYRIAGGKIVEFRGQLDMMGLMQQLGVIPSPQQAVTGGRGSALRATTHALDGARREPDASPQRLGGRVPG